MVLVCLDYIYLCSTFHPKSPLSLQKHLTETSPLSNNQSSLTNISPIISFPLLFFWYLKATETIPLSTVFIYYMFQVTCLSVFFHYSYLTLCPMYWIIGRMSSFPVNIFPILFCTLILEISILPR